MKTCINVTKDAQPQDFNTSDNKIPNSAYQDFTPSPSFAKYNKF